MGFLDKPLGDMSRSELQRLIRQEVYKQLPPIPAGVASLEDHQIPVTIQGTGTQDQVVTYNEASGQFTLEDGSTPLTDGLAPSGTSPTASVIGGINFIAVSWTALSNADAVAYDVHLGTAAGFAVSGATLCGTVTGTFFVIKTLPQSTTALSYSTNYYVKIVAFDNDGVATTSVVSAAVQLVQIDSPDIATNAVTAVKIVANAITAEKLESFLVLASTIQTASSGARVVMNTQGIRLYAADGTTVMMSMDALSGTLTVNGLINFGRDPAIPSRLTSEDLVDLHQLDTASATRALVQSPWKDEVSSGGTTVTVTMDSPTSAGNLLFAQLVTTSTGTAATHTTPAGWTLVSSTLASSNRIRLSTYKIENAATKSSQTFTFGTLLGAAHRAWAQIFEWSGVATASAEDKKVTASGSTSPADTGNTAATTQNDEIALAILVTAQTLGTQVITTPSGYTIDGGFAGGVGSNGGFCARSYHKSLSATAVQAASGALAFNEVWVAQIVTFKAKSTAAGPGAAGTDRVRLYAKEVVSASRLHVTDEAGTENAVVLGTKDEVWRMEIMTATIDPGNLASHSAQTLTVTLSGLVIGDYCFFIGHTGTTMNQTFKTRGPCTVTDTISLGQFNMDTSSVDMASQTFYFMVIHKT